MSDENGLSGSTQHHVGALPRTRNIKAEFSFGVLV